MIPGLSNVFSANPSTITSLSDFLSGLFNVTFYIVGFLMFFWMVWGVFEYIFAGGDKDKLAAARKRITYAIIGFLLVAIAFSISKFIEGAFLPNSVNVKPVSYQEQYQPVSVMDLFVKKAYAANIGPFDIGDNYAFGTIKTLSQGIGRLTTPAFSIAGTAVIIYLLYGAFRYLTSGGDKGAVASVRGMITHAIIGFILLMLVYLIILFIPKFFGIDLKII